MQAVVKRLSLFVSKYVPDAYIFALLLTFVVFLLGMIIEGKSASTMMMYWGDSFWKLIAFAFQMALMLILGHVIAMAKPVQNFLSYLIDIFVKGRTSAVIFITLVGITASLFNWGFALVIFAIISKEVAKKRKDIPFSFLLAACYSGFLVWHGGMSASTLLKIASPSGVLSELLGGKVYPLRDTVLSSINLTLIFSHIILLVILNLIILPKGKNTELLKPDPEVEKEKTELTFASKLEGSKIINSITILFFGFYLYNHFIVKSLGLNINITNGLFFLLALILHTTPKRFMKFFNKAVPSSAGILLQFSFYSGIMGMMTSSGLAETASQFFVGISNENTFPVFTYLSAGLVNLFVPSGGGQWAVQAPIVIPAALEIGVPVTKAALAVAWGDAWTNMLQPFWMVPVLSIAGLAIKDIMAQCFIYFVFSGILTSLIFLLF
ncbi:MAG: short-chain fatty acids transporter [Thermoproteota archaeon]|jgi:short-chain fatty acids transporter